MIRVGEGYDVHRLVPDRRLIIGGVFIEHETGLLGHSDADVLAHASADAVLGACGLGDIGRHFPDSDPAFKDADSMMLLAETARMATQHGYDIVNLDACVIAQSPRLAPYMNRMAENIAKALGVFPDQVNIKATTEEGLGFTGRKEGIAARAVCLVERKR